jgi:hypothetical protein
MLTNSRNPATAGQRAGSPCRKSFGDDDRLLAQKQAAAQVRLQFLAGQVHALGPKPLFHLLDEVERGAPLRQTLEVYAALPVDLVRAYRGDRFPEPFAIRKVRRP